MQLRRFGAKLNLSIEAPRLTEEKSKKIPEALRCPITQKLMHDPVMLESGHTYEREAITNWLKDHDTDYVSQEKLESKTMLPNKMAKKQLEEFLDKQQHLKHSKEVCRSEQAQNDFIKALSSGEVESLEKLSKQHSWLLIETKHYELYWEKASEHQKPANLQWLIKTLGAGLLGLNALADGGQNWLNQQLNKHPSSWLAESLTQALGFGASEQLPILQKQLNEKQQQIEKLEESLKHGGQVGEAQRQQLQALKRNVEQLSKKIDELSKVIQQKDQKIDQLQQENQRNQQEVQQLKLKQQQSERENQQLKQKHQSNQQDIERLSKKIEKYRPIYQQHYPQGLKLRFFSEVKENDLNYKKKFHTSLEAVDYISNERKRQKDFNPKDLEALMKEVMEGNLEGVTERLNKQPQLIQCQMKWVDYAGRVFPKITPFQLAVWYGDWGMWERMRDQKSIKTPINDKQAALQYHSLKQYSKEISGDNGPKYSFKILLDAYAKTERLYNEKKYDECGKCFVKEVGGAQRSVPYWYQYLMSEAGECDWTSESLSEGSGRKGGMAREVSICSSNECGEKWGFCRGLERETGKYTSTSRVYYISCAITNHFPRGSDRDYYAIDYNCCTKCDQKMNQTESKLEKSLPLNTLQLSVEQNPKGVENNSNVIQFN